MAEKDVVLPHMQTMRPPAGPPPANHGRTVAAWTTTWVVVAGGLIASIAVVAALTWLLWAGLGVCVLGVVIGKVMSVAGLGQRPDGTNGVH
ncbi:MAG: hypothetical protein KJ792_04395 [Actinobacteria bacterium]|nr:hypothetical protein [Actinomycetota bacterium]MCG2802209.1 hypothetical protein [Cellulomonas sp.]